MQLDSRTETFTATIEFCKLTASGKLGKGLDWAIGEGSDWSEVFESARKNLIASGESPALVMSYTAKGIEIGQQWDANGIAI